MKTLRNSCRLEEVQMSSASLGVTRMSTSEGERVTDDLEMKKPEGERWGGWGVIDGGRMLRSELAGGAKRRVLCEEEMK